MQNAGMMNPSGSSLTPDAIMILILMNSGSARVYDSIAGSLANEQESG
jgi:hypothetical protein